MNTRLPSNTPAEIDSGFLDQIETLLDEGMYLQVHPHVDALIAQGGARSALLAVRALRFLGAERSGDALVLSNFRRHRHDGASMTAMIRQRLNAFGPYMAWCALGKTIPDAEESATVMAEYLSLKATVLCALRDFDETSRLQAEARALDPLNPWLWVEWSYCCERADRYDEALAAADHALELFPYFRAAVQQRARLITLQGRHGEAEESLESEFMRGECALIGMQLFDLQYERADFAAARRTLDRIEALQPRADRYAKSWLAARRTDVAMGLGNMELACSEAAKVVGHGFYANVAERIGKGMPHRRVMLPVEFVRQHWNTCAPATLTALSRYFGRPAEHLEIAEEICYDGTPDTSERGWVQDNGFVAREFRVDPDSARALIDAGLPFTLTTTYTGGGHLQAVIGYDLLRNSLLIRDPFEPTHGEFDADRLVEQHRSSGPRGMVMVPPERIGALEGIALPDADIWDRYHALVAALALHDRDAAAAALAALQEADPAHRLTLQGERTIAMYDGNETEILRLTEALLERYPDDVNLQLSKAASLWAIGGRAGHIEWLAQLANRPRPDPLVLMRYADRLAEDGRRLPQAQAIMRRALRYAPANGRIWCQFAGLEWQAGRTRESLPAYRFAACLNDTDEGLAATYHRACHLLGDTETGIAFLRARVARLGAKSPAPAMTLFEQLEWLERVDEALAVLDEALALHPDDGTLLAYCAEVHIRHRRLEQAESLLSRIDSGLRRANWLRVKSLLADARDHFDSALEFAREACTLEPLNLGHHRQVAMQLARRQGRDAAVEWLRQACARYPYHFGLNRLCYDWIPDDAEMIEAHLRHMAATHPGDVWVLRELATQFTRRRRFVEARQAAEAALARAPGQSETHGVMAYMLLRSEGYVAALPYLQRAVSLNVDNDYALRALISEAPGTEQARAAIRFAREELVRQVTVGDGLLTFQQVAQSILEPEELLATLREALDARPDLWHAWAAYGIQLVDMGRAADALPVFTDAITRFSSLPRLHVEKAQALKLLGRRQEAREQLDRALLLSPSWNRAVRLYVDTVAEEGMDWQRAEAVVRRALARNPEDADLQGLLAWLLERSVQYEDALKAVSASLRLDPRPRWIWNIADRVCQSLGRPQALKELVAEVESSRPGDPWAWVIQAQQESDDAAALRAAERAVELEPQHFAAWEARLDRLLRLERYDELECALAQAVWTDGVPVALRAYAARAARGRGDKEKAREMLRALIAEAPNDYDLWRQLADWCHEDEAFPAYLEAARELVRIAPNFARAHGYFGHALVRSGSAVAAIPALERALEIEPDYLFAVRQLLEVGLQNGELEAAARAAEATWHHHELADLAANATWVASRRGRRDDAERWLTRTLQVARYDADNANRAIEAVREAGWGDMVVSVTEQCIRVGRCAHVAAVAWVEQRADRWLGEWRLLSGLDALLREEADNALKMALISYSGKQASRRLLDRVLSRYGKLLRDNDGTWGEVSWALLQFRDFAGVVRWMDDWQDRAEAPSWALGNLALAQASLKRTDQAAKVAAVVLAREPRDPDARLWQCVDSAVQRDHDGLKRCLESAVEWRANDWMVPVLELLRGYLDAVEAGDSALAVKAFRSALPHQEKLPSLRHVASVLGRRLVREYTPWWLMPWRWLMLAHR